MDSKIKWFRINNLYKKQNHYMCMFDLHMEYDDLTGERLSQKEINQKLYEIACEIKTLVDTKED